MIIFPATGVFANLGGMGVSMFFLSTVIAQLVFTLGGSGFAGANGSMMIEVVVCFLSCFIFLSLLRRPAFHCLSLRPYASLWFSVHCYVWLCLSMLPCAFLHPYATSCPLCTLSMRPYVLLSCVLLHSCAISHFLYPSSHPCHPCASFVFPTILVRRWAFLCILMSFCAPSTFFWPSLGILMAFSLSFRFSVSLCASFDSSAHPCASFGLSLDFLPFYLTYPYLCIIIQPHVLMRVLMPFCASFCPSFSASFCSPYLSDGY